jgi:GntR family transcriptional repressor for pyruvate dehydrogenase complex
MFAAVGDPPKFLVCDIKFHRAIAEASGNKILAALVEMVSALFYERRRRTVNRQPELRTSAETHLSIYHAVRDHDRARAERLMSEHLLDAERQQLAEGPEPEGDE